MILAELTRILSQSPKPGKDHHLVLHIASDLWDDTMHLTQGRTSLGGVPLVRDSLTAFAETRIEPNNPRRPGWLAKFNDWLEERVCSD